MLAAPAARWVALRIKTQALLVAARYDESLAVLEIADSFVIDEQEKACVRFWQAVALERMGRPDDALRRVDDALSRSPSDSDAAVIHLVRARLLIARSEYQHALDDVRAIKPELLPEEVRASAQWWEQHLVEVLTGVPPDAAPGTAPRPEYDPRRCSLRQRELAKHAALTAAGQKVALSTLQRLRRRYELEGVWSLVDRRYGLARRGGAGGRVDSRVVEATRQAIAEETSRSTGTVARLRRRA